MRIAVTGRHGQLAQSLKERASLLADVDLVFLARPEVDLAHPESISPALAACAPDLVINASAYTEVDKAESEQETAFAINAAGAGAVASAAASLQIPVIQIGRAHV